MCVYIYLSIYLSISLSIFICIYIYIYILYIYIRHPQCSVMTAGDKSLLRVGAASKDTPLQSMTYNTSIQIVSLPQHSVFHG